MLVGEKGSEDPDVDTVHGSWLLRRADRIAEEATRRLGLQYLYFPSSYRVRRHPWVAAADVLQIYNTHGGYFTHRLLPALALRAPLVWRLSDAWAMTGHCAFPGPCERWRTGCGRCPALDAYPPIQLDTTAYLWQLKLGIYRSAHPTIVVPSSWAEGMARQSPLFQGLSIHRIPNGVDLNVFRPMERAAARRILGLPAIARIALFSAQVVDRNERKGTAAFIEAARRLAPDPNLSIVLVGAGGDDIERQLPHRVIRLGFIADRSRLALAYAAADVVVAPSNVENLPNSVLEALACGTPIIAFDAGGLRDAVREGETGWLVPLGDIDRLRYAIEASLTDSEDTARRGRNGRALIEAEFTDELEISRFADLYSELTRRHRRIAA